MNIRGRWFCTLLAIAFSAACRGAPPEPTSTAEPPPATPAPVIVDADASLYLRLRGAEGVHELASKFAQLVVDDPTLKERNPRLAEALSSASFAALQKHLETFLCERTGGPCKYDGPAIGTFRDWKIQPIEWGTITQDLLIASEQKRFSTKEREELQHLADSARDAFVVRPLFQRLGGEENLRRITDQFVDALLTDKLILGRHADVAKEAARADRAKVKTGTYQIICTMVGGACRYAGKTMAQVHQGYGLEEEDWSAMLRDLVEALTKNHVGPDEQREVLAAINRVKSSFLQTAGPIRDPEGVSP